MKRLLASSLVASLLFGLGLPPSPKSAFDFISASNAVSFDEAAVVPPLAFSPLHAQGKAAFWTRSILGASVLMMTGWAGMNPLVSFAEMPPKSKASIKQHVMTPAEVQKKTTILSNAVGSLAEHYTLLNDLLEKAFDQYENKTNANDDLIRTPDGRQSLEGRRVARFLYLEMVYSSPVTDESSRALHREAEELLNQIRIVDSILATLKNDATTDTNLIKKIDDAKTHLELAHSMAPLIVQTSDEWTILIHNTPESHIFWYAKGRQKPNGSFVFRVFRADMIHKTSTGLTLPMVALDITESLGNTPDTDTTQDTKRVVLNPTADGEKKFIVASVDEMQAFLSTFDMATTAETLFKEKTPLGTKELETTSIASAPRSAGTEVTAPNVFEKRAIQTPEVPAPVPEKDRMETRERAKLNVQSAITQALPKVVLGAKRITDQKNKTPKLSREEREALGKLATQLAKELEDKYGDARLADLADRAESVLSDDKLPELLKRYFEALANGQSNSESVGAALRDQVLAAMGTEAPSGTAAVPTEKPASAILAAVEQAMQNAIRLGMPGQPEKLPQPMQDKVHALAGPLTDELIKSFGGTARLLEIVRIAFSNQEELSKKYEYTRKGVGRDAYASAEKAVIDQVAETEAGSLPNTKLAKPNSTTAKSEKAAEPTPAPVQPKIDPALVAAIQDKNEATKKIATWLDRVFKNVRQATPVPEDISSSQTKLESALQVLQEKGSSEANASAVDVLNQLKAASALIRHQAAVAQSEDKFQKFSSYLESYPDGNFLPWVDRQEVLSDTLKQLYFEALVLTKDQPSLQKLLSPQFADIQGALGELKAAQNEKATSIAANFGNEKRKVELNKWSLELDKRSTAIEQKANGLLPRDVEPGQGNHVIEVGSKISAGVRLDSKNGTSEGPSLLVLICFSGPKSPDGTLQVNWQLYALKLEKGSLSPYFGAGAFSSPKDLNIQPDLVLKTEYLVKEQDILNKMPVLQPLSKPPVSMKNPLFPTNHHLASAA